MTVALAPEAAALDLDGLCRLVADALTAARHTRGGVRVSGFVLRPAFPQEGAGVAVHHLDWDHDGFPGDTGRRAAPFLGPWAVALIAAGFQVRDLRREDGVRTGLLAAERAR